MRTRGVAVLLLGLLMAQFTIMGCLTLDDNEESLPTRKVRTVIFPVRPLRFEHVSCKQELGTIEISGALINISPRILSNMRVQIDIFIVGDILGERFLISTIPSLLYPGQSADFKLSGTIDKPIAHVELHPFWDPSP